MIGHLIANAPTWLAALLDENEQLTADLAAAAEECDRLMDLYLAQRREHNKAAAEVERLRAALDTLAASSGAIGWRFADGSEVGVIEGTFLLEYVTTNPHTEEEA